MFKNMSLSTKMAMGFGTLMVITAVLGVVTWSGLRSMGTGQKAQAQGSECAEGLNKCAALRREFTANGFAKAAGETKDAAEKWADAYAALRDSLQETKGYVDQQKQALVSTAIEKMEPYKGAFDKQAEARKSKDQAFEAWRQVGKGVTENLAKAQNTVIEPGLEAAVKSQNATEIARWASISSKLNDAFVQQFLLARVAGVYLMVTEAEEQWTAYLEQIDKTAKGLAEWTAQVQGEQQLEAVAANFKEFVQQHKAAAERYHAGIVSERTAGTEMASAASGIVEGLNKLAAELKDDMDRVSARTNQVTSAMTVGAIILGIVLTILITRSIVRPINRIISGLNEGADQVNDAAAQVSSAAQQLAEGASEQASSLEETSSALEEMAAMTRTNAENARQANELTDQAKQAAENGDKTMGQLNVSMTAINDSSNQISKIIKVIQEIAFQTNLLALNAAVEAARAGEHGKGFAVVAEEVRNLAQRAAQASKEITGLIEDSVGKAREGTNVAGEVGRALGAIVNDVSKVADLVNGITRASQEQAQGVDQINTAVSQMDKVTQQNASGAEESASAAEEMSAQATTVKSMVEELSAVISGSRSRSDTGRQTAASTSKKNPSKVLAVAPISSNAKVSGAPQSRLTAGKQNIDFTPSASDGQDLAQF